MEIVGKTFKRKNSNDIHKILDIDNGFVIFDNNARCKIETLMSDFDEISQNVNENFNFKIDNNTIDPDKFFNTPLSDDIIQKLNEEIKPSRTVLDTPSVVIDKTTGDKQIVYNKNFDNTTSDINNTHQPPKSMMNNEQMNIKSFIEGDQNDINKHINTPINNDININKFQTNEPAEWNVFKNVKLTEELELTIPITIKLPKPQKIDVLNDMFESSFIEYLAQKEIDNLLKDKKNIINILSESIEDWISISLYGKVNKKKKSLKKSLTKKSNISKKSNIKKDDIIVSNDIILGERNNDFSLMPDIIKDENDLDKVKSYIKKLEESELTKENEMIILSLEEKIANYLTSLPKK